MADKFNFDNFDIDNLDPDKIPLGTTQQDCSLIAQTFEKAAHTIPTEAAVFATITRQLQNHKTLTSTIAKSLKSYDNDATIIKKFKASEEDYRERNGLKIEDQTQPISTENFAKKAKQYLKDCIPCEFKLLSGMELKPSIGLIDIFENYINGILATLSEITGLLNNLDVYADFCTISDFLHFVCVPDLQRIVSLLSALLSFNFEGLTGLLDILQSMIVPIFAPILIHMTVLLDKFTLMIVDPLECITRAIDEQIDKLSFKYQKGGKTIERKFDKPDLKGRLNNASKLMGLQTLSKKIKEGTQLIREKLKKYEDQIHAMIAEVSGGDKAFLEAKLETLTLIRLIAFVIAIITAIVQGASRTCSPKTKTEEQEEIQKFFDNFMNPSSPFTFTIDDALRITIEEKLPDRITNPPEYKTSIKSNSFTHEGSATVNSTSSSSVTSSSSTVSTSKIFPKATTNTASVEYKINELLTQITTPVQVKLPCKFATSGSEIDQVNKWISELNKM